MNGSTPLRIRFKTLSSTNSWAKEHGRKLNPEGITVVTADEQTEGRGREHRKWHSPSGVNLYASFCSFIPVSFPHQHQFAHLLSLSAAEVFEQNRLYIQIKWPNDLVAGGKKIAGILTEIVPFQETLLVVNGIGVNLNMQRPQLEAIDVPATSLLVETEKASSIQTVLSSLTEQYAEDLARFIKEGFAPFFPTYKKLLLHKPGEGIAFHSGRKKIEGKFHSIASNGSMNVEIKEKGVLNFI